LVCLGEEVEEVNQALKMHGRQYRLSSGLDSAHRGNQAVHLLALLGEPGVEIEMARRRYASQRFTALGVGNQAASLLRLGRHAGTEELEA
jgi:hypothetical protein